MVGGNGIVWCGFVSGWCKVFYWGWAPSFIIQKTWPSASRTHEEFIDTVSYPLVSWWLARLLNAGSWVRFTSRAKFFIGFSIRNFSVAARRLVVGGVTPPRLGKHVAPSDLRLISPRSCRIAVPSDYESERRGSAPVFVAVLRRSLTVRQKPESLTASQSYQEVSCCSVTVLWRSDRQSLHVQHWYSAACG